MSSDNIYRSYYEDDIRSATPQRLRLLLIDGAIRFAKASLEVWESDRDAAFTALGRCRNIVIELIGSIRADRASCQHIVDHMQRSETLTPAQRDAEIDNLETIARNTMSVYLIVFRHLDQAQLEWDGQRVAQAVTVLEEERETTRIVCEKHPAAPVLNKPHMPIEISSSDAADVLAQQDKAQQDGPQSIAAPTYGGAAMRAQANMSFDA